MFRYIAIDCFLCNRKQEWSAVEFCMCVYVSLFKSCVASAQRFFHPVSGQRHLKEITYAPVLWKV